MGMRLGDVWTVFLWGECAFLFGLLVSDCFLDWSANEGFVR